MSSKPQITKLPAESAALIDGEIGVETLATYRPQALATLQSEVKLDGFRPGQVPENLLIKTVGEERLLLAMAQAALAAQYPKIIKESGLDPLGPPTITITKLAPGNPFGYKLKVAVYPEVTLPANYADLKYADLMEKTELAIPPIIVDREIEKILSESADQLQKSGKNSVTAARELRPVVESQVKLGFIIDKIAKTENISGEAAWERLTKKEVPENKVEKEKTT